MTTQDSLVSVIVPVYNAEPYLRQCLDSVLAQTHETLEVLCLDDGSTDNSGAILDDYAAQDARVRVVHKPNEGYGKTCNRGLALASGEWIAVVEPDDWIEPAMYEAMLAFAASLEEPVDIVKTPYWRIWNPDTPRQRKLHCSYKGRIKPRRQPFHLAEAPHLLSHHPSIWSALYKRSFLEAHDVRFHEIPGAGWADNPFLIDTLVQADGIAYLDKPFYCYREETEEKSESFAKASPLLPFDRWNDMADSLERLKVGDEGIWRAHNSRGFTYLSGVIEYNGLESPAIRNAAVAMFKRMDAGLVLSDPEISPGCKKLFCKLRGLPAPRAFWGRYGLNLVREGLYSLRNTGLTYTLYQTTSFLHKRDRREGRRR